MKIFRLLVLLSALSSGLSTFSHAQTGQTENVVVKKSPAKATGYVPTAQANGTIIWALPTTGASDWASLTGKPTTAAGFGITNGANIDTWGAKTVTASAAELNYLVGVTSGLQAQLNGKQSASANLDTWATKAVTASQAELNYLVGVTSGLQAQLDGKQPLNTKLTSIGALANSSGYLFNNGSGVFSYATPAGGGDFSSNTSSSVDSEFVLFSSTAGKTGKRATGTGLARGASGVASFAELSGDATTSGSNAVTLATVNSNVGTFGSAANYVTFTVNGKGLVTAATQAAWPTFNQNTTGNAATVTTNANSTGAITSVGNATSLGSFTFSAFNSATTGDDAAGLAAANAFTGINQFSGSSVTNANALGALAIDVTKSLNTKTVSAASTFTFSGTPATSDTWFALRVTNSDSSDRVMTIPSSFNANTQATATFFTVLAGGTETITWCYDGSRYVAYGIPSPGYSPEQAIASATTTDLGASASINVSITGTTTITGLGTVAAGTYRQGRFTGALTLTHNATSLIIPGGASITTAAGDRFGAISLGSGNWVVYWYTKANGTSIAGASDSAAIHGNVSAEISALTSKATPTTSDLLIIEDAAASNAKKKVTIDGALAANDARTKVLTNTTLDAAAPGNVLKLKGYVYLTHPHLADGTNATIGTTATAIDYGHATFSNSVDQASNYVEYYLQVPEDIDTSVALRARIKVRLGGADTASQRYVLSSVSVADSAVPTSSTLANAINIDFAGDASGASGDVETSAWTTLTSWNGALTAGQTWRIRFARDGDTSDASTTNSTELGLVIEYGITQ